MEITYSARTQNLDRPAIEAAEERPDKPIRIRVQPTLLREGATGGSHRAWPGVSWSVDCKDAAEAIGVRRALEAFFVAIGQHGAAAVEQALTPPGE